MRARGLEAEMIGGGRQRMRRARCVFRRDREVASGWRWAMSSDYVSFGGYRREQEMGSSIVKEMERKRKLAEIA